MFRYFSIRNFEIPKYWSFYTSSFQFLIPTQYINYNKPHSYVYMYCFEWLMTYQYQQQNFTHAMNLYYNWLVINYNFDHP